MGWPDEPFLNLRQTTTPNGDAPNGGQLVYVKSDGKLYTKVNGVERVLGAGGDVTLSGAQTLTNKTVALGSNTVSGTLAQFNTACTDDDFTGIAAFNAHTAGTAVHGATGAVVGTTNTQTVTNKTLSTGTLIGSATTDISGAWTSYTPTLTNMTLGNGTFVARYVQIGKAAIFRVALTGGSTSTAPNTGTPIGVGLPVQASGSGEQEVLFRAYNATNNYIGWAKIVASATSADLWVLGSAGAGVMGAWGAFGPNYIIVIEGTYEAA